jgi:hypothetical protein
LIATKKNLEAATLRGFYKLLPQLVGSFDPGGGVSGDGNAARIALLINGNAKSIRCISA